jgi:hypothetical protein
VLDDSGFDSSQRLLILATAFKLAETKQACYPVGRKLFLGYKKDITWVGHRLCLVPRLRIIVEACHHPEVSIVRYLIKCMTNFI